MTPHLSAKLGEIAPVVLMPGDPLRAEFIANTYLKDVVCYNKVRNMYGFTGTYEGMRLSVQASGMGCPSMGIYSHELYAVYGVESIIRIGTAGAIADHVNLRDLVAAVSVNTNSNFSAQFNLPGQYSPCADFELLKVFDDVACETSNIPRVHFGNILCSDTFYDDSLSLSKWQKIGALAVEMESFALYCTAARLGKKALAIMTISDCPLKNLATTAEERQTAFTAMLETALKTAKSIGGTQ
jgi:purine-nucleoside phosphorylase